MSNIAIVFPGQGSQKVGMGLDFYSQDEESKKIFDQAFNILGESYKNVCFEGPPDKLKLTTFAQPLIFLISTIIFNKLKKQGISPKLIAGHSLGELTAYHAGNVLNLENTLRLITKRSTVMAASYPAEDSAMSAVLGSNLDNLSDILNSVSQQPVVCANYNCPSQIVISGTKAAIHEAKELIAKTGSKIIDLPVSGAFHSPLMNNASENLKQYTETLQLNNASTPIVLNKTASQETNAEQLKENIYQQVNSSVQWTQTIQHIETQGIDLIIECGPGKVLAGLIKKTTSIPIVSINSLESLEKALEEKTLTPV